jgi:cytochrome c-type biogenesis protein CcmH/NrfG
LLLAQDAFNSKKFKQATVFFEEILKTDKSAEIRFFYAISLLEENNFNMAENIFQELHKGSSIYKEKALWYLALSKLKQKKYEECRSILETIPSHTEDYQKAQQLLNDL